MLNDADGKGTPLVHNEDQSSARRQQSNHGKNNANDLEDSTDDEFENNERQQLNRSKFTIRPDSSIKTAWDCLGFLFIVIQSI